MVSPFWTGIVVSLVLWFAADEVGARLFSDELTQFVFSFTVAVIGGGLVMALVRVRAMRSGRYEKARWGVKRRK